MKKITTALIFIYVNCFGAQDYWVDGLTGETTDEPLPDNLPVLSGHPTLIPNSYGLLDAVRHSITQEYRDKIDALENQLSEKEATNKQLEEKILELENYNKTLKDIKEVVNSETSQSTSTFIDGWAFLDKLGWVYTNPRLYPYFFVFEHNSWFYHFTADKHNLLVYSFEKETWQYLNK